MEVQELHRIVAFWKLKRSQPKQMYLFSTILATSDLDSVQTSHRANNTYASTPAGGDDR